MSGRAAAAPADGVPLRVALVSDWYLPRLGGIEIQMTELAHRLREQGHVADVFTTFPGPASTNGITVHRIPGPRLPHFEVSLSLRLAQELRRRFATGYDVVHIHLSVISPLGWAAIIAARAIRLPMVVTFHSVLARSPVIFRLADWVVGWSRWNIVFTAVSKYVAAGVLRCAVDLRVDDLPNGVEPTIWNVGAPRPISGPNRIRVVSAMRLNRIKRPQALLKAFLAAQKAVARQGRELTLQIAGDGPCRWWIERSVRRHNLSHSVTLHGALGRAELVQLYANVEIFLLASKREAFGIAALEARLAGLTVLGMADSGIATFLQHDKTALLAKNDAELAKFLARAALDDDLRRRLTMEDPTLSRYSWKCVLADHIDCYYRAINITRGTDFAAGTGTHDSGPANADIPRTMRE
jgi:glycosyltransferase involved in cell wall biosynthesis